MLTKIEDIIKEKGFYISSTSGYSMYPMLRNCRDTIVVRPVKGRLKKYDVPLYKVGDRYVLHRIIKVCSDSYVIRGDNCTIKEYGITDADILGLLAECYRDDKKINLDGFWYKAYSRIWCMIYPLRFLYKKCRRIVTQLFKLLFRRNSKC